MAETTSKKSRAAQQEEFDRNEDKYRMYASIAFMAVVLVVGIPMWWKTTEVYRVKLPSSDIARLRDDSIVVAAKIGIFTFNPERSKLLIKELSTAFEGDNLFLVTFESIPTNAKEADAKTPAALEKLILTNYTLGEGDFMFIEWPKLEEEVLMTTERSGIIRADTSAAKLKTVIEMLILQTQRIKQILTHDQRLAARSEAPQAEYDVVVSVLNPNPELMDVKWNVQLAVETYIAPFLREVNQISNYTLKTQWKFQVAFEADLKQIRDSSKLGRHYALSDTSLPHIITSIEKQLGVGITDKKVIHLIVYVPPCTIAPVHIYKNDEKATKNGVDSFISPNWGGIIIANPPLDACLAYNENLRPVSFYLKTNDVMQIMLHQLHKLLDITMEFNIDGVKAVPLEQLVPRRWEYDAYIRRSTVMHIATATNTLQSLIKLLNNISYIVINDEVGAAINEAYNDIQLAKSALAKNQLYEASLLAKRAFVASEQAFFDASLLAQLYFPDEQKYAIYIPLFLPIMVPVITSFSTIRKLLIKTNAVDKVKVN